MKTHDKNPARKNRLLPLILLSFVFLPFITKANELTQPPRVTLKEKNLPLKEFVWKMKDQTNFRFVYNTEDIEDVIILEINVSNKSTKEVLDLCLAKTNISYTINDKVIVLHKNKDRATKQKSVQEYLIKGIVKDSRGLGIPSATIRFKQDMSSGTITDIDGNFTLKTNSKDPVTLVFSFIGYQTIEQEVSPGVAIKIVLQEDTEVLDEVVITGYQTFSEKKATGAYTVLGSKALKSNLESSLTSRMEGLVAGVNKTPSGEGGDVNIIRGITSYRGDIKPLYVLDGLPYEGDLNYLNPSDIVNVTVLKDAAAAAIYGARASNGVIVITTRKGVKGTASISYNASIKTIPVPNLNYLNLVSSSELVDLQIDGFNHWHMDYTDNVRYGVNPIVDLLYQREQDKISIIDFNKGVDVFRNLDNRKQILDEFSRVGMINQHDLSISGGSEQNQFLASINYLEKLGTQRSDFSNQIGFVLRDNFKMNEKLSFNMQVSGTFYNETKFTGADSFYSLITSYPSYYMIRDENGGSKSFLRNKSELEMKTLREIGLEDEHFSPIDNFKEERHKSKKNFYRIMAGLNYKIIDGLDFDLKYSQEKGNATSEKHFTEGSYFVRNMINDAAQYDKDTKELVLNVPKGGQLNQTKIDNFSYTFRAQLNHRKNYEKHMISSILGAERRLIKSEIEGTYYMGYDDESLQIKPINPLILNSLRNTKSIDGSFVWNWNNYNYRIYNEDRYVSFYANSTYTFNEKYAFTGSVRTDQSNLFGTNPKYQYRPLWSVGSSWMIGDEKFMSYIHNVDLLKLRLTYGIGGNVPKEAGPFLTLQDGGYNSWIHEHSSEIKNPPNTDLRWEKTVSFNAGIDFSFFNSRLSGSIDIYNKKTTDLLGWRNTNSVIGASHLLLNYGSMSNKGVELMLKSTIIQRKDWYWGIDFTSSYNKNELTNLDGTEEDVFYYTSTDVAALGYPLNSLFSYRYAGLSPEDGSVLVYKGEGAEKEKVNFITDINDLVYSGTRTPKYNMSMLNRISFKNFDFSFLLVYYGGHVMRGDVAPIMVGAPTINVNKNAVNYWRKPGDEKKTEVTPAMQVGIRPEQSQTWYSADVNVKKADYIKLRNISLSYNLPQKWLENYKLSSISLTGQISDVFTWAANGKIDPEAYTIHGYGYGKRTLPISTSYTIGFSVNF